MPEPVYILGGYQSDFATAWSRRNQDIAGIARETVLGALASATLDASAIESIHVGNAFAELQRRQAHLGAMPATVIPELVGVPAMRHEAACASGSLAVLATMSEIEAGRYHCVLALGVEEERNTPGDEASANMNAAGWEGHEPPAGKFLWPSAFGELSFEYERRYGLKREHLNWIAQNNFANARRNPLAQTRAWNFGEGAFTEDDAANPPVAPGMRRNQCSQLTDGGCAVVLASARFAQEHAQRRGIALEALPRILGWGHRTAELSLGPKLERARMSLDDSARMFPHVQRAVHDALRRARLSRVEQTAGVELHDCFAVTEYSLIDHLGLAPPGEAWRVIENGDIEFSGRFPVNPSGGLIGGGHPVGATGTRMLWDAARQVTGRAGACQVPGAKTFLTLNIGGSFGTVCSFVVGAAA